MDAMESASMPARNSRPHGWTAFTLALALGTAIQFGALMLFRPTIGVFKPPQGARPTAHIPSTEASQFLLEKATLSDPSSLYMITPQSFAARTAAPAAAQPQHTLSPFALQPTPDDVGRDMGKLAAAPPSAAAPTDALKQPQWNSLSTLGSATGTKASLPERGAQLSIRESGAVALGSQDAQSTSLTWPANMAPDAGGARWGVGEFMLMFTPEGLSGLPQLQSSTGVPRVDEDLRQKLADYFRRHPLAPGYYTVEIGP